MKVRLALLLLLCSIPSPGSAQDPRTITVFAAASLSSAFTEAGAAFERTHSGSRVLFNFAGSQQLALQLEHGARADLFASADERWMRHVAERGLLAGKPRPFAGNRLVVVVAQGSASVRRLADLARPGVKVVLAAEAVPAGKYSREVLARLDGAPGLLPDFSTRVQENVVSLEENVRAVVAKVLLGEADAGMAYASDTVGSGARLVALPIPGDRNVLATYPIAPLRDGPAAAAAAEFTKLLMGAEGRRILERHGFLPPSR